MLRRFRIGVLPVLLVIVSAGAGAGARRDYSGEWKGAMSDGGAIEFSVTENRVTRVTYWLQSDPGSEQQHSRVDTFLTARHEIVRDRLRVRPGTDSIEIAFRSETSAKGRIMSSRLIPRTGGSKRPLEWSAKKADAAKARKASARAGAGKSGATADSVELPVYIDNEDDEPFVRVGTLREGRESRREKRSRDFDWSMQAIEAASTRMLAGAATFLEFNRGRGWCVRSPRTVECRSRSRFLDVGVEIQPEEGASALDVSQLRIADTGGSRLKPRGFGLGEDDCYYDLDDGMLTDGAKVSVDVAGDRSVPHGHVQLTQSGGIDAPVRVHLLFEVADNEVELTLVSARKKRPDRSRQVVAWPQPPRADEGLDVASVKKGMAADEVRECLGDPQSAVQLGGKEVWFYGSAVVRFVDGKVTTVEAR